MRGRKIAELALEHRLPSVTQSRAYAHAGGLTSYGPEGLDGYRRAAAYVDKVLKGAKPGDLPIEQPTKFVLVINARAAQALNVAIPASLVVRADEVVH